MSELIVSLPHPAAGVAGRYAFVQTRDGQAVEQHGNAAAATLPGTGLGRDVVAVVPVQALSWHQVQLPKGALGAGGARLRAVLEGLLEDRLLDDPALLHFALSPYAQADRPVWVAVCDKAWLQSVLAPLEAAGRPVSRIVPECIPLEPAAAQASPSLQALGGPDAGWLVRCDAQGVAVLPLVASAAQVLAVAPADSEAPALALWAEPAVVETAERLLGRTAPVQTPGERWLRAVQTPWELAQFDLSNSGRQRAFKKLSDRWRDLLHAPQWRALRAGVLLLLVTQVLGLNAWAWREKSALADQRAEVRGLLTQTFPHVKVVVDAPVQMARELAVLRQATGAASSQDLEQMLSAVGAALPNAAGLRGLDYADNSLRLKGLGAEAAAQLGGPLASRGYALRQDGDALVIAPAVRP
ncbi:MAG: putative ral secretion pathway protein component of type secretion system [Pseudomonadota bacterium]|jgi:general secretion pathway protein L